MKMSMYTEAFTVMQEIRSENKKLADLESRYAASKAKLEKLEDRYEEICREIEAQDKRTQEARARVDKSARRGRPPKGSISHREMVLNALPGTIDEIVSKTTLNKKQVRSVLSNLKIKKSKKTGKYSA